MSFLKVKKYFPFIIGLTIAWGAWAQTPVAPVLSAPTCGAVGQGAALTLSWGSVDTAATYTVQLSATSDFSVLTVNAPGLTASSYAVSGLTIGITYYWQVSATSAADSTGPWSAVWSFSTLAVPATPTLAAPANAAANEPTSLTLTWNSAARATAYDAQISIVSTFATTVLDEPGLTASQAAVTGLSVGTEYFWRVDAGNTSGTSAWSGVRNFTTALPVPVLSSPSDSDTGVVTPVGLSWGTVTGATTYAVQVSTGSGFTTLAFNQAGLTASSDSIPALASGTMFYWRANANNGSATGAWTTAWSFVTGGTVLAAPVLASPTNGTTGLATSVTLAWNTTAGATTYSLEVSTGSAFSTMIVNQPGLTMNSSPISGLSVGTTYYWMVNAACTGSLSLWSTVWSFSTLAVPAAPTLSAPANGTANEATSLTLAWNAAARAVTYGIQVATVSTFATTVFSQTGLTGSPAAVSGLAAGTVYYWKVNATDAAGSGAWSAVRNFTTGIGAPIPTTPASGETDLGKTVSFTWESVSGAATYTMQISTSISFATTVMSCAGITGTALSFSNLSDKTIYFWEVRAVGTTVSGAWSAVQYFEIDYTSARSPLAKAAGIPTLEIRNGVIAWSLQRSGPVEMAVFDLRGRSVFALNRLQPAGSYSIDLAKGSISPGRYLVWFKSGVFEKRTAIIFTGNR